MAVYAPGDSLPDPSQGIDPGMWARLMNYLNPIQPAAADTLTRGPNPLNNPSPVPAALQGGGPPVPPAVLSAAAQPPAPVNPLTQPSAVDPRLVGGGPPIDADTLARIQGAPIVGGGGSSGGGGASMPFPQNEQVTGQRGMPQPPGYGPETTHMPYPGQTDPRGVFAPKPAAPISRRVVAAPIRARPAVRPVAAAAGASPFGLIDRPNMGPAPMYDQQGNPIGPVSGGALARGGPPKMTALDLSRLFNRG